MCKTFVVNFGLNKLILSWDDISKYLKSFIKNQSKNAYGNLLLSILPKMVQENLFAKIK